MLVRDTPVDTIALEFVDIISHQWVRLENQDAEFLQLRELADRCYLFCSYMLEADVAVLREEDTQAHEYIGSIEGNNIEELPNFQWPSVSIGKLIYKPSSDMHLDLGSPELLNSELMDTILWQQEIIATLSNSAMSYHAEVRERWLDCDALMEMWKATPDEGSKDREEATRVVEGFVERKLLPLLESFKL